MPRPQPPALAASRERFYAEEGQPSDGSFWNHYLALAAPGTELAGRARQALGGWRPVRSNCPELTDVVEDLVDGMPHDWQPVADELFVGRVIGGEVNATAETSRDARIVRLDLQYTSALFAYATAWDEQMLALRLVLGEAQAGGPGVEDRIAALDAERFARYWDALEVARADMLDPGQIAALAAELRVASSADRTDERELGVLLAESWVVCHEVAHHLLGHTLTHRPALPAAALVAAHRYPELLDGLNPSQADECDADVLAFLLLARACDPDVPPGARDLYRAQLGAALGLIALTHVNDGWTTELGPDRTHPGLDRRWPIVEQLARGLGGEMPIGAAGDHPFDLMIDLTLFASAALDAAARRGGQSRRRLRLLDLADAAIDCKQELRDQLGKALRRAGA